MDDYATRLEEVSTRGLDSATVGLQFSGQIIEVAGLTEKMQAAWKKRYT